jgi:hypothetical protein
MDVLGSEDQIFYQSTNEEENRAKAVFDASKHLITFHQISQKPGDFPKYNALFQITVWHAENLEAETLKNIIATQMHGLKNSDGVSYIELTDIGSDIYDKELKVTGIPMTYVIIYKDFE